MSQRLRARVDAILRTDSELDAFCLDEFPALFRRFSRGMERIEKVTLLLSTEESAEIETKLEQRIFAEGMKTQPGPLVVGEPKGLRPELQVLPAGANREAEELSFNNLRHACASIVTPTARGIAYLVHASYLMTSASLVSMLALGSLVEVGFPNLPSPILACILQWDLQADWAIIKLPTPVVDRMPLPLLAPASADTRWVALGFLRANDPEGLAIAGDVQTIDREVLRLSCDEAEFSDNTVRQGATGAPVMSRGRVIGHLRSALGAAAGAEEAGLLFACSASSYMNAVPTLGGLHRLHARTPVAEYDPLWYSSRPDLELRAMNKLRDPGVPLTVQAPEGYGKQWFVEHVLDRIRQQDLGARRTTHIIRFNVRKDAEGPFTSLDALLRPLLRRLLVGMKIERMESVTRRLIKSVESTALQFREGLEEHVLRLVPTSDRLLLLIEEGDRLHASPIETDFFALLRALAEERSSPYERLRLVVTIAAEAGLLETTNHSWFFGLSPPIVLEGFNVKQLQFQAALYGLSPADSGLETLQHLTSGHPFLSRLAMYEAANSGTTLAQLLQSRGALGGVFSASLQRLHAQIDMEGLMPEVCQVLKNPRYRLPFDRYIELYRKSVIFKAAPGEFRLRCQLFEQYFGALCQ